MLKLYIGRNSTVPCHSARSRCRPVVPRCLGVQSFFNSECYWPNLTFQAVEPIVAHSKHLPDRSEWWGAKGAYMTHFWFRSCLTSDKVRRPSKSISQHSPCTWFVSFFYSRVHHFIIFAWPYRGRRLSLEHLSVSQRPISPALSSCP